MDACSRRGRELKQAAIVGPGWQQRKISIARLAVCRLGGVKKTSPTVFQVNHGELAGQCRSVVGGKIRSLPLVVLQQGRRRPAALPGVVVIVEAPVERRGKGRHETEGAVELWQESVHRRECSSSFSLDGCAW